MNWTKVQTLALTPREPSPELLRLIGNASRANEAGCLMIGLGALAAVASAVATAFTSFGPLALLGSLLVAITGGLLMAMTRKSGLAQGAELARTLPLVLVGVVQANDDLYRPEGVLAGAVFVHATEGARGLDPEWFQRVVARVRDLKNQGSPDPRLSALVQALWDPSSVPDQALPLAMTEGVPARVFATAIDADKMPGKCLPPDGIVPALLEGRDRVLFLPGQLWS